MVAEVIHGAPCRFTDPARFSLAHGGKDGHPFPVPLRVYDETIGVLRRAVERAKLGDDDRLAAIRRLDEQARRLESPAIYARRIPIAVAAEHDAKTQLGGRTVADHPRLLRPRPRQLGLAFRADAGRALEVSLRRGSARSRAQRESAAT